jgi:RNA polymerase sigma-70 factor (ECF subfamily)
MAMDGDAGPEAALASDGWSPADDSVARMLAFQRGDEGAFDALYLEWHARVHRFASRMVGSEQAEEIAQETFVRLYRARARYRPTARFSTWLFQIAAHLCTNERRRAFRRHEVPGEEGAHGPAPDSPSLDAEGSELAAAVDRALAALPERQRAAVVLARWEGCSMAELAEVLQISEGAAKVLLHRARERLRVALGPWLSDAEGRR